VSSKILVSVIIPCRNEAKHIEQTIKSILNNHFDCSQVEIIIVDGMSDDNTMQVLNMLTSNVPNIKVLKNINRTTPYAFNLGIKNASGDFILIVGARHLISNNYITECLNTLELDNKIAGVGGRVRNMYDNTKAEGIALAMSSPFGVGGGNFRAMNTSGEVDTIGTPMYRKQIFDIVGLFDEDLARNQDDEFNFRVIKAGYKLWLNCNASISYVVRSGFANLFKQYFQYGYWKVCVNKKLKTITTIRQIFPFLFVVFILFFPFILFFSETIFLIYPTVIVTYLFLILITSVYLAKSIGFLAMNIFFAFLSLHFAYGLGYLNGFIDFILINRTPSNKMKNLTR
jgi:glycosyltransferase involved in cell wall biosynthesis